MKIIFTIIAKMLIIFCLPMAIMIDIICFVCKCIAGIFYSVKEEELYSNKECKQRRLNRAEKRTDEFFNITASTMKALFA